MLVSGESYRWGRSSDLSNLAQPVPNPYGDTPWGRGQFSLGPETPDLLSNGIMKLSKEYTDYIESKEWRKLRAAAFSRFGKRCQCCGATKRIHGHHLIYRAPVSSGTVEDIMPLCQKCHDIVHSTPKIDRGFRLLPNPDQRRRFILRCFRAEPVAPNPKPVKKPKPPRQPIRIKPPPDPVRVEFAARIQAAKIRDGLVKRGIAGLGLSSQAVTAMSSESIKKRLRRIRREGKRKKTEEVASVISQMRAQLAANPNCTHFVFA